uniref:YTH domain-containing protein n=1 Tax=Panagrellus redivivus TaxID=6233 RepID=A0A7E4UN82_PANRE
MLSSSDPVKSLLSEDNPKAKDYVSGTWPCDNGDSSFASYGCKVPDPAGGQFYPNRGYPGLAYAAFATCDNGAGMCGSPPMFGYPGSYMNNAIFDFESQHFASKTVTDNTYFHNLESFAASKASQIHCTPTKNGSSRGSQMTYSPDENTYSQSSVASSPDFHQFPMPSIKSSPVSRMSSFSLKSSPTNSFIHESSPSSSSSSPQSFQSGAFNMMGNGYPLMPVPSYFSSQSTVSSSPSTDSVKTLKSNATALKAKAARRRRMKNVIPADGIIFKSKSLLNKRGSSCFSIGAFVVRLADYSDDLSLFNNSLWNVTNHNLLQRWEYCMREGNYTVYKPTDRYTRWLPQFPDEYILVDDIIPITGDSMSAVMLPSREKVITARANRDQKRREQGLPVPITKYRPSAPSHSSTDDTDTQSN